MVLDPVCAPGRFNEADGPATPGGANTRPVQVTDTPTTSERPVSLVPHKSANVPHREEAGAGAVPNRVSMRDQGGRRRLRLHAA